MSQSAAPTESSAAPGAAADSHRPAGASSDGADRADGVARIKGAAQTPGRSGSRFLREFLSSPIATAAIAPSSKHLAAVMLRGIDMASLRTIVEFGPGTGVFTRAVLESLREAGNTSARFIALELNPRLAAELQQEFAPLAAPGSRGPSVEVLHDNALNVDQVLRERGVPHADFILSGLGWPSIKSSIRDAIIEKTHAVLAPGREFRTFGYHIGLTLPGAWAFRKTVRRLFSRVTISPVIWRNIPPAFVYACVK